MKMDLSDSLNEVFREVFDDPAIRVTSETTANDVDGWDSLSHINLILAVETKFRIKFSQKELLIFKKVGDLLGCIQTKISL